MAGAAAYTTVVGLRLLDLIKARALQVAARAGVVTSSVAVAIALLGSDDQLRRALAAGLVLAAWSWAAFGPLRLWSAGGREADRIPDVEAARRVLWLAALSAVPFAVDGHAQSNVFLALCPLAGVVAAVCRRLVVAWFAFVWSVAYLAGTVAGAAVTGGGLSVLTDDQHPFDAFQQIVSIVSISALFAATFSFFCSFVNEIPGWIVRRPEPDPAEDTDEPALAPARAAEDDLTTDADDSPETTAASIGPPRRGGRRPAPILDHGFTAFEEQVLLLKYEGKTEPQIAEQLHVSAATIKDHTKKARERAGVAKTAEAVVVLVEHLRQLGRWPPSGDQSP